MIECLYIAGTLFVIGTNSVAVPLGPNSVVIEHPDTVQIVANGGQTHFPKGGHKDLAAWLQMCDDLATAHVMEMEQW